VAAFFVFLVLFVAILSLIATKSNSRSRAGMNRKVAIAQKAKKGLRLMAFWLLN